MSIKENTKLAKSGSSTSTPSARKRMNAMMKIQNALVPSSMASEAPQVVESSSSRSRLEKLYSSDAFKISWDNEIGFHVAQHALHLRRFREMSQSTVADAMGTSQSKVARIEAADENITLKTLKRLAVALRGRIRFAIEPAEVKVPHWPFAWWDAVGTGLTTDGVWTFQRIDSHLDGMTQGVTAKWTTTRQFQMTGTQERELQPPTASGELT